MEYSGSETTFSYCKHNSKHFLQCNIFRSDQYYGSYSPFCIFLLLYTPTPHGPILLINELDLTFFLKSLNTKSHFDQIKILAARARTDTHTHIYIYTYIYIYIYIYIYRYILKSFNDPYFRCLLSRIGGHLKKFLKNLFIRPTSIATVSFRKLAKRSVREVECRTENVPLQSQKRYHSAIARLEYDVLIRHH